MQEIKNEFEKIQEILKNNEEGKHILRCAIDEIILEENAIKNIIE